MDQAFDYWKKFKAESEEDYPYKGRGLHCAYDESKGVTSITGYVDVEQNELALKEASAQRIVSVAVDATLWQFYFFGVYDFFCSERLNHGVTLVGYGYTRKTRYWLIKNSWGGWWGQKGYIQLKRHEEKSGHGKCGVALQASYPTL